MEDDSVQAFDDTVDERFYDERRERAMRRVLGAWTAGRLSCSCRLDGARVCSVLYSVKMQKCHLHLMPHSLTRPFMHREIKESCRRGASVWSN